MKIHDLVQGSPEWHAHRADHWNASDAPAMMGCSPYKTRSQFLHERFTGIEEEITPEKARIFAAGHAYEAQARPLAEIITGKTLYPVTGSEGPYSASFDGIDMVEEEPFEHKSLNDELRACMPVNDGVTVPEDVALPKVYRIQMEQQLMVSGGKRVLFMASKWNGDTLIEERHCWYYPDAALRAEIVAGWAQFEADLQAYEPPAAAAPAPVGKSPETLPALHIEVKGQVTSSNLAAFKTAALAVIRGVNLELKTDEDFAHAEKAVKWCEDTEERLAAAKQQALAQTATIEALFRTIDEISAEARDVRLALTRDVKARKEAIKGEIVAGAITAFAAHVQAMQCPYLPRIAADFAGAAKNKRTVASLQDAVDTELARVKIEANGHFQRITQNLATLAQHPDHAALFPDTGALVLKAPDDLAATIDSRIAKFKADDAARQAATPAPPAAGIIARGESPVGKAIITTGNFPGPLSGAPRADDPATLNLGAISERLEFTVSAAFMVKAGLEGVPGPRGSKLFTETQFTRLCHFIARHCMEVASGGVTV